MLVRANIVEDEKPVQSSLVERETKRERERGCHLARRPLKSAETRHAFLLLAEFAAAAFNTSSVRTLVHREACACNLVASDIIKLALNVLVVN